MKLNIDHIPDLTRRPPRSPRVRLGGYAILPRVLDKGRATLAGKNGEYKYGNPLDQRLFDFLGVKPEGLLEQLKLDKGDFEILQWLNSVAPRAPHEIAQWTTFMDNHTPGTIAFREHLNATLAAKNTERDDIRTLFDLLDLDDHTSFGGKA
ncbi:MAG: DUF5069 domain-containing protein [Verrucomicrobiales bacterium]|jgi:hypothetical protein|nr:DUF5069 domain-containing protein [Verrucomicrobiales bacterium]